jgi:predicted lipoprotein with Yx(FWY)xxD motif
VSRRLALALLVAGAVAAAGGCGGGGGTATGSQGRPPELNHAYMYLEAVPGLGVVMVDSRRRTLYHFGNDVQGSGSTTCYGACARVWRPALSNRQPAGESGAFHPEQFGTIRRRDGRRQATYFGWPLYTYAGEGPHESKGAGLRSFGGTWYALRVRGGSVTRSGSSATAPESR